MNMEKMPDPLKNTDLYREYMEMPLDKLRKMEAKFRQEADFYRESPNPQTGQVIMHHDMMKKALAEREDEQQE